MLRWRLVTAAALIGPLVLLIWLDDQQNFGRPGFWLCPLAVLVSIAATHELNVFLSRAGLAVSAAVNLVAVGCVTVAATAPLFVTSEQPSGRPGWVVAGLVIAVWLIFLAELVRYQEPGKSIQRLAGGGLAVGYIGLMIACLILIRLSLPPRLGLIAIIATIWVVKLADAGAYFVGKKFGRTKLCRVSPKKTVEGLVGGALFATVGALLVRGWMIPNWSPEHEAGGLWAWVGYGVSLTIAGLMGDLGESLLKRDVNEKDSSRWMPGLGGMLDVVDSLLATAPVSLAWWCCGLL